MIFECVLWMMEKDRKEKEEEERRREIERWPASG